MDKNPSRLSPWAGKQVWITGAGSGIGRALALVLAKEGAWVWASARSAETLSSLVQSGHERVRALPLDVTSPETVAAAASMIHAMGHGLDLLICCAGDCEYVDARSLDVAAARRMMEVNFYGALHAIQHALPLLRERAASGAVPRIAGVGSLVTHMPFSRAEAYGASKAALHYFLESLRLDLYREGIGVSIIKPGFVRTPLTDRNDFSMPFLMEADTAAAHILRGLDRGVPDIVFPRRLSFLLSLCSALPARMFVRLAQSLVR